MGLRLRAHGLTSIDDNLHTGHLLHASECVNLNLAVLVPGRSAAASKQRCTIEPLLRSFAVSPANI